MRRFYVKSLTILALATFGFLSLAVVLDRGVRVKEAGEELAYLPSARYLKPALLGFETLAADLFWIQTIQYFGKHVTSDRRFPKLFQLVDLVTSLDPQFIEAYRLGGLFLAYFSTDVGHAIALYEKGIASNPDRWELPHDLARLYYLELKDYGKALEWFQRADQLPGRAQYIPHFVARLYAATGQEELAVEMWWQIYHQTTNEEIKEWAKEEIQKLLTKPREGSDGKGGTREGETR
ncbi:MAG: hypothetical protein HY347_02790 [candidate division NC10 bacterium]|nr:hypothetical protein [candidate division NC10 bacterium]